MLIFICNILHPTLFDHVNIIALGVGLCFAYIFISSSYKENKRKRNRNRSGSQFFLKFIDDITIKALDKNTKAKMRIIDDVEITSTRISYYLNTGKLQDETKGSFKDTLAQIEQIKNKIISLEKEWTEKIYRRGEAKHLGKISFFLGLYGVFLLFISRAEIVYNLNILPFLFLSLVIIGIILGVCLISEYDIFQFREGVTNKLNWFKIQSNNLFQFTRKKLYPSYEGMIFSFIVIVVLFFTSIFFSTICNYIIPSEFHHNHINEIECYTYPILIYITLSVFFIGFIFYYMNTFFCTKHGVKNFKNELKAISPDPLIDALKAIVRRHQEELDRIDNEMTHKTITQDKFKAE